RRVVGRAGREGDDVVRDDGVVLVERRGGRAVGEAQLRAHEQEGRAVVGGVGRGRGARRRGPGGRARRALRGPGRAPGQDGDEEGEEGEGDAPAHRVYRAAPGNQDGGFPASPGSNEPRSVDGEVDEHGRGDD